MGPISLTFSDDFRQRSDAESSGRGACARASAGDTLAWETPVGVHEAQGRAPCVLPMLLFSPTDPAAHALACAGGGDEDGVPNLERPRSISQMSTAEWRETYEQDGCVDLWVEEEFNSGSRLVVGRDFGMGWAQRGKGWGDCNGCLQTAAGLPFCLQGNRHDAPWRCCISQRTSRFFPLVLAECAPR